MSTIVSIRVCLHQAVLNGAKKFDQSLAFQIRPYLIKSGVPAECFILADAYSTGYCGASHTALMAWKMP